MAILTETGKFLEYNVKEVKTQQGSTYLKHEFTFSIPFGVTTVDVSNDEYIEGLLEKFKCNSMEEFVKYVETHEMTLYFVNSEKYIGFSFTEPFKKNHFPKRQGVDVLITNIEHSPSGILFELEDGTIANRNFSTQIGGNNGQWSPNLHKKLTFIKNLGLGVNPLTFDLDTLKGMLVSYYIKPFGSNEYFEITEVKPNNRVNTIQSQATPQQQQAQQTQETPMQNVDDFLNQFK